MFFKVVLKVCAAAQRSGDHGRAEEDFDWQVSFVISKTFILKYTEHLRETVLTLCFPAALKEYLRFNGCLPSRVIVYRDGVGDGQLHSVVNYEVQQIMDSITSMGQDYK